MGTSQYLECGALKSINNNIQIESSQFINCYGINSDVMCFDIEISNFSNITSDN